MTRIAPPSAGRSEDLTLSQYLEWDEFRVHNPHTNRSLDVTDPAWVPLRQLVAGLSPASLDAPMLERLTLEGWIVDRTVDLSTRYHLRLVSLETVTTCNQSATSAPCRSPRAKTSGCRRSCSTASSSN